MPQGDRDADKGAGRAEAIASMSDADERARLVAELRDCARGLLTLLQARGEALLVISSGVVVVNADYRDLDKDGIDPSRIDDHYVRAVYAPAHECVHMSQLLTTRFVLEMGIEFFNLCVTTNTSRRQNRPEADWLPGVLDSYREAQRRLNAQDVARFSSLQVLEAHAVLEGFVGGFSRYEAQGLELVRRLAHGNLPEYSQVIDTSLDAYGFELTLSVLPRLCWLALNTSHPGSHLSQTLDSLKLEDVQWLASASASQTCRAFGLDATEMARSWRIRRPGVRDHPLHPLLGRYFDVLESETDPEAYLRLAMHPGRGKGSGSRIQLKELMPPMAIYADNVFVMNGPYRDDGWDTVEPLLRVSAILIKSLDWLEERARQTH
jgi:hypothetical protein